MSVFAFGSWHSNTEQYNGPNGAFMRCRPPLGGFLKPPPTGVDPYWIALPNLAARNVLCCRRAIAKGIDGCNRPSRRIIDRRCHFADRVAMLNLAASCVVNDGRPVAERVDCRRGPAGRIKNGCRNLV